ncbi:MAG: DEAD/DEAH box helicase family protein [Fluviicoccus sp.]|uniref:TOTE conflict system archaeo-eukaryotic primase domain-containing protein n=1 Tax=Fluviicoccus sp. TaxID=2003552 RepID=UPI002722D363|nr:DEAD/DEAH box helicase family protein [Fluviicoccus sp.]MDO8332133.1 DEAD/DEAH box helicase family protein [Fluviicoccus sp.]
MVAPPISTEGNTASEAETDELHRLQSENARLTALLEAHGIEWRLPVPAPPSPLQLSPQDKIALFRRLFNGRTDTYPIRWESQSTGKSGYAPACGNEWRSGVCEKPRIKCGDCNHRQLKPLTDAVIYDHLAGKHTIGVYPLLDDDRCYFLAVDFDEADWREDARAFVESCESLNVPCALEISRSGQGAHVWIFFSDKVPAREARRLGTALISHTCERTRQLTLTSYDRLFPNQDTMPKGGFGNLIALPLQKKPRDHGYSVFVDRQLQPYADQWAFLASIRPMSLLALEITVLKTTGNRHPLDVTFVADEDLATPWKRAAEPVGKLTIELPATLTATLANMIYFDKTQLPQPLANRLIRLAAFQNPEFYKAQALRLSVWDKPRVIGCAENFPRHIALPRGCLDAVQTLMKSQGIRLDIQDERCRGEPLNITFNGTLRLDQEAAVAAMLHEDFGILCAPTAFGKTVTAAALIAERKVNTLILVHRSELLKQWQERLQAFLGAGKEVIGTIGGGKSKPTGNIDIALMQSISRQGEVSALVDNYGHVIVDECHHIGAASFDAILKRIKAKYVLGLTATPIRRDGLQPIIFMQCGPIRYTAAKPMGAPHDLEVAPRFITSSVPLPADDGIQDIFRLLASDPQRTETLVAEIVNAYELGRKVLVLTERTDHLAAIQGALESRIPELFVLHGRIPRKQRQIIMDKLHGLAPDTPHVLLATGKLVGEGFDHPALDTLILAMPVSWRGTLQQYAGRLHRECATKTNVRIVDLVDQDHPALLRMWEKRRRGYAAMGYRIME